jgi:hypothetical protein
MATSILTGTGSFLLVGLERHSGDRERVLECEHKPRSTTFCADVESVFT